MENIGRNIRRLRKLNERKQTDIAGCLGISTRQYRKMENEEIAVKSKYIVALAETFNVSVETVLHLDKSLTRLFNVREKETPLRR